MLAHEQDADSVTSVVERAGPGMILEPLDESATPSEETADDVQTASEESFPRVTRRRGHLSPVSGWQRSRKRPAV